MENNFVPECYFDTVLVKTILKVKHINHQKGCSNVVREINEGKLKDDFAVGIIDKDKRELDYIKDKCKEEVNKGSLILLKHETKHHYFIQLAPALEKWIIAVVTESKLNIEDFGLPANLEKLKKATKTKMASENESLKNLCKQLVNSNGQTIATLSSWLNYLFEHNRNADINVLRANV